MDITLYVHGSRDDVRRVLRGALSLSSADPAAREIRRGVLLRAGCMALSKIQQAFRVKADGGTDEAGDSWPYLSKKYLAYGRRFYGAKNGKPSEQRVLRQKHGVAATRKIPVINKETGQQVISQATGQPKFIERYIYNYAPNGQRGLLSKAQVEQWGKFYGQALAWLATKMPIEQAKQRAAQIAWSKMKARGAKTKLEVYGTRKVQVLRDTGVLHNSLSPGYREQGLDLEEVPVSARGKGAEQQEWRLGNDDIYIGTNVPYAAAHHYGHGVPLRRLWPELHRWPTRWWDEIAAAAQRGLVKGVMMLIQGRVA